ncbi:hypothetical protein TcWFU_008984 [Taenia crassiceps]|uniref:Uncharacterized protein n=1 Tax=Taenia crassiceps TaxID=6207 RepID=A0ABR4QTF0_9CEST
MYRLRRKRIIPATYWSSPDPAFDALRLEEQFLLCHEHGSDASFNFSDVLEECNLGVIVIAASSDDMTVSSPCLSRLSGMYGWMCACKRTRDEDRQTESEVRSSLEFHQSSPPPPPPPCPLTQSCPVCSSCSYDKKEEEERGE